MSWLVVRMDGLKSIPAGRFKILPVGFQTLMVKFKIVVHHGKISNSTGKVLKFSGMV